MRIRGCGLIEENEKILTLFYRYPKGDVYAIPGGGVKDGELLKDAIIREYREELGIEIEVNELRYVGDMLGSGSRKQTLHVVFNARRIAGEPLVNPKETSATGVVWLEVKKLKDINLYPAVNQPILKDRNPKDVQPAYLGNCMGRDWA